MRRTPAAVAGPLRPSTAPAYTPCARNATCSAATRGEAAVAVAGARRHAATTAADIHVRTDNNFWSVLALTPESSREPKEGQTLFRNGHRGVATTRVPWRGEKVT